MMRLNDKIVLITGATSGIGAACARRFAEAGCRLILLARRKERLLDLQKELAKKYKTSSFIATLDVRDHAAVTETISSLPAEWRSVDILINNAGLARGMNKFHEIDMADAEDMINTNIKGLIYVSREVIPGMVQRGRGHIINIGSTAGHEVYARGNVYCATKHAVDALTKGMRIDLVDTPVRVSTIDPGLVETEFSIIRFGGDEKQAANVYNGITPLVGDDIADIAVFIASRPQHVQIGEVIVMPTDQAAAAVVYRR